MEDSFGIPQVVDYLSQMDLKVAQLNLEQNIIELAFHGDHGQWRMIVTIQQSGDARKLILIAPHISTVTARKRLQCLEALLAVNYRIALGKFGLDLDDGEVRLEETIPLADHSITFEQFRLVFGAMVQTAAIYHSLLPRIIYGDFSVPDAIQACEQEYFQKRRSEEAEAPITERPIDTERADKPAELDVNDVLAEVTRLLEDHPD
jgi:hypothetical protein